MVPIFNPLRNFWVVRADKGKLFHKFLAEEFVGIAHVDSLPIQKKEINSEFFSSIYEQDSLRKIGRNKITQIRSFIDKISIDDWVITLNHQFICIGKVTEQAQLVENDEDLGFRNKINIRRKVIWGPTIKRVSLPHDLSNSLKTNLTVFNINKCCESIYHTIFPFFIKDNRLYTTALINTQSNIKTKQVAQLFQNIALVESISTKALYLFFPEEKINITSTVKGRCCINPV